MREKLRFLGLDVHAETIAVAVAEPGGEVRSLGTIANREESIRKFIRKLGPPEQLRACYEAGLDLFRAVLAAGAIGYRMCGGGAEPGSEEARRSGEDGSKRRVEAGTQSSFRRSDCSVGSR